MPSKDTVLVTLGIVSVMLVALFWMQGSKAAEDAKWRCEVPGRVMIQGSITGGNRYCIPGELAVQD